MNSSDRYAPPAIAPQDLNAAINLRLALLGLPLATDAGGAAVTGLMEPILARQREAARATVAEFVQKWLMTQTDWKPHAGKKVEENVTVVDVSPAGDWSRVKVWYNPINALGTTVYPTYGFVYKGARDAFDNGRQMAVAAANEPRAAN
mgnify:CR=1 FL=1